METCPLHAHAPDSPEGMAAWAVCQDPGVWRHAGMAGICTGLDVAEALARIPGAPALDAELLTACLRAIEAGRLIAEDSDRPAKPEE